MTLKNLLPLSLTQLKVQIPRRVSLICLFTGLPLLSIHIALHVIPEDHALQKEVEAVSPLEGMSVAGQPGVIDDCCASKTSSSESLNPQW